MLDALDVQDKGSWIERVNKFTDYIIERTELIREIDEDSFDFAHKTFFEYFLAIYFTKCMGIKELKLKLDKWIGDSNFDELANLIIEVVIEENVNDQHISLINHLYDKLEININNARTNDSFMLRKNVSVYLSIFSKLFSSKSLLPKFIEKYHQLLIQYPEIIHYSSHYFDFETNFIYDKEMLFTMLFALI